MWHLLAMYIPHPERAVVPAFIQLVLIAVLAGALYAYLCPRCGRRATLVALSIGELISFLPMSIATVVGLGQYGDTCRGFGADYCDSVLVLTQHFELYSFAIWSFISLLLSALILFAVKTKARHGDPNGRAESPPVPPPAN